MFKIIFDKYLEDYDAQIKSLNLDWTLPQSDTPVFAPDSFSFYTSVASVYSSKIEGDPIDASSCVKFTINFLVNLVVMPPFLPNKYAVLPSVWQSQHDPTVQIDRCHTAAIHQARLLFQILNPFFR